MACTDWVFVCFSVICPLVLYSQEAHCRVRGDLSFVTVFLYVAHIRKLKPSSDRDKFYKGKLKNTKYLTNEHFSSIFRKHSSRDDSKCAYQDK